MRCGQRRRRLRRAFALSERLESGKGVQPEIPGVYTVEYRLTQTIVGSTRAYTGYAKLIVVVEG